MKRSVLPYSFRARSSPPQTTQPSCWKAPCLSPRPQQPSVCHTPTSSPGVIYFKNKLFSQSRMLFSYVLTLHSPLQPTWNELTGTGLAGLFTGVAFGGASSGGGGFCCTARLWLVTASCKAFNTCKVRKNINQDWLHHCQSSVLLLSFDKHNRPFSPVMKGGWSKLKSYTTSCPFPSLDPVSENGSNKLWIVTKGC